LGAIGVAPFAIESMNPERQQQITDCYALMASMSGLIVERQPQQKVIALSPAVQFDWTVDAQAQRLELGGVIFEARFDKPSAGGDVGSTILPTLGPGRWEAPPGTPLGAAMILQLGPGEFAILGRGVVITFAPADGVGQVGIDSAQEGRYDPSGQWIGGRWLNGDQTHQGRHIHLYDGRWAVQRIRLYRYR
jgi:hypothetical protein